MGNLSIYRVGLASGKIVIKVTLPNLDRDTEQFRTSEEPVFLSWKPSSGVVLDVMKRRLHPPGQTPDRRPSSPLIRLVSAVGRGAPSSLALLRQVSASPASSGVILQSPISG